MTGLPLPPIPRRIEFDEIDSTQSWAKRELQAGRLSAAAVVARRQTSGRGRLGRSWESPDGGLYMTLCAPVGSSLPLALSFNAAAAVAACDALRASGYADVAIKWPNDLLLGDRKLGGILSERATDPSGRPHLLLGLGVNVRTPVVCPGALWPPVSLAEDALPAPSIEMIREEILTGVWRLWHELSLGGGADLHPRWVALQRLTGQRVEVHTRNGTLTGRCIGFDSDFHLRLQTAEGVKPLSEGDCGRLRRTGSG